MQVASAIAPVRDLIRALPDPVAFVPTMGALHEGHLSLIEAAREHAKSVVASVFVNPLQFGPTEDYAKYPRDYDGDFAKLAGAGVDVLFAPDATAMYPTGFSTTIDIGQMAHVFEGEIRKTHFAGVVTVVAKLLNIVQPDILVLGQKDAQQTAVLRKLIRDLGYPVDVQIVPTAREPDGLARSSRNAFLTREQRAVAPTLYAALCGMREALLAGKSKYDATETADKILTEHALLDYFDIVDADTFEELDALRAPAFVIGAARFGSTRLLDNLWIPG